MSLINQVLQDLEKRHASEAELRGLSPHVRPIGEAPRRGFPLFTAVLAVVSIAAIAGAFYFWNNSRTLAPSLPPPANATAPEPKLAAPAADTAEPADPVVQAVLLAPASRLSQELSFIPTEPRLRNVVSQKPAAAPLPARRPEPPRELVVASPSLPAVTAQAAPAPLAPEAKAAARPEPAVPLSSQRQTSPTGAIDKQMREMPPGERAEMVFRTAVASLRDGRVSVAEQGFRDALEEDPNHIAARQALLGLLLDSGRKDEAEALLRRALELNPRQPRHAMVLARLEVERGELTGAINTLVGALPYVGQDPDYYAFLAALLQRESRHKEAVDYYRAALQTVPGNAVWMMGMGMSLRANNQIADARDAFQRAAESRQLNAELQVFVERQLRELNAAK